MASLESELGSQLFIRSKLGLILTEAGKLFYQYLAIFFMEYAALQRKLNPQWETDLKKDYSICTKQYCANTSSELD